MSDVVMYLEVVPEIEAVCVLLPPNHFFVTLKSDL